MPRLVFVLVLTLGVLLGGCAETKHGNRIETYPLTGKVLVDGKPVGLIKVTVHDVAGVNAEHPTFPTTYTDDEGKFSLSTYEAGDGVPAGEYVVCFYWGEYNLMSRDYGGKDKLGDRYRDPKTSPIRVQVEEGKPADMGTIELSTK